MRCLGPLLHRWDQWVDGQWTMTKILTMGDGVPAEMWGTKYEYNIEGQSRYCKDCGRKQVRRVSR